MGRYLGVFSLLWILLLLGVFGCSRPDDIADEVIDDYEDSDRVITVVSSGTGDHIDPDDYVDDILGNSSRLDLRIPSYSYFQGLIQSRNHIILAGQVRIVGGILGADEVDATASFYLGAMVTSNPDAFVGSGDSLIGGPAGLKTRVSRWEEIPSP